MRIAITGTPGTGKTEVAKELAGEIGCEIMDIKKMIESGEIEHEKAGDVMEIDPDAIRSIDVPENTVVEGNLAHYADVDVIVVLRTRPDVLEKRLRGRGWSGEKVEENVGAEILDSATVESLEIREQDSIMEIDTTDRTAQETSSVIKRALKNLSVQKEYRPGKIDWTDDYIDEITGD